VRVNVANTVIRQYGEVLGLVATHAAGDSDDCTSLRAYCTNAGVGWAAGAGCGRNVAIVKEPYTQRVGVTGGEKSSCVGTWYRRQAREDCSGRGVNGEGPDAGGQRRGR
jgi:hypothetical protein